MRSFRHLNKGVMMINFFRKFKEQIVFAIECITFLMMLAAMYFLTLVLCALSDKCAAYYGMMGGL
jgi:hypothetical protein